jgi:hypothetical protein
MSEEQANSVFIGDNVDNAPGLFVITKDKDSFISLENRNLYKFNYLEYSH